MSQVIHVDRDTFEAEVVQSELPVVVDFYATWCPPCRMLEPILDRLSHEFSGKIKFAKIDSDEDPELASEFNVTGLPTVVFVEQGKIAGQFAGLPHEDALRGELSKWIESRKP